MPLRTGPPEPRDADPNHAPVIDGECATVIAEIERLRRASGRLMAGDPLERDLADWLGTALQGFLSRRHRTVEEALGLRFAQGGVPWWREEAIRVRDAALRELGERFFPGISPHAQARRVCTLATRYAASAWRHDRDGENLPDRYLGTAKEYLWRAFASGAAMPIGERQLRNVLAR